MLKISNFACFILLLFLAYSHGFPQQRLEDSEYKLKAAYTFNFTKFITWQEESDKDFFHISVLGDSEIYKYLSTIARTKQIHGKPIKLAKYPRPDDFGKGNLPNIKKCDILFIPKEFTISNPEGLKAFAQKHILVIGEADAFAQNGGLINFTVKRNKLVFEINHSSLISCGFKTSPRLLKLAILVDDD